MDYQEISDADIREGEALLSAAGDGDIPAYEDADFRLIFELAHGMYEDWGCWRVIREGGHLLIDGVELMTWIAERQRDPGWDEMRERSFRLRSIRQTPACLITGSDRLALLRRAANGEPVRIATGEKSSYRHVWIVEGEAWLSLWKGNEEQWRAELCDPNASDAWPYCRQICHRRPVGE